MTTSRASIVTAGCTADGGKRLSASNGIAFASMDSPIADLDYNAMFLRLAYAGARPWSRRPATSTQASLAALRKPATGRA